jgi:hypothetical protein
MTSLLKAVISTDLDGKEQTYDSISLAAKFMLTLEKFKDYNVKSIRTNISNICRGDKSNRNVCCGFSWKFKPVETFEFIENDWKQFRKTLYYFSEYHEFCYNINKKSQVYGNERGFIQIYSQDSGYSIYFIEALWISYNGEIPDNKHVAYKNADIKSNLLENLECLEFICSNCNKHFESDDNRSKFCSDKCKNIYGGKMFKQAKRDKLRPYIAEKIRVWKKEYNLNADEIIEKVPGIKDLICQYCGTKNLQLCSDDNMACNKLSIDAKNPGDHSIDNLIGCCLMCNRMKNDSPYEEWIKLLNFLKGNNNILDLSNYEYVKKDTLVSTEYSFKPWSCLNIENSEMFKDKGSSKKHFIELFNNQNKKDSIFKLFPLVMLTRNNLLNISCDKIIPSNNTEWQLIPVFLNYAKSIYSTDRIILEFKNRNFLQNTEELSVILPIDYEEMSAFYDKLKGNRTGKGQKGMKHSDEFGKKISQAKKGKNLGADNVRSKPIISIDKSGNSIEYAGASEAVRKLGLPIRAVTNISSCALGKLNTAYGLKWSYL